MKYFSLTVAAFAGLALAQFQGLPTCAVRRLVLASHPMYARTSQPPTDTLASAQ